MLDFVRENGRVKIIRRHFELDFSEGAYEDVARRVERTQDYDMEHHLDSITHNFEIGHLQSTERLRIRDLNDRGKPSHPLA